MYSGTTFRIKSGRLMGVHQRIDRVARRHIASHIPATCHFPAYRDIVHFEGKNGPDGIKRKSPAVDEPWHYINPDDPSDTALLDMIDEHIANLSEALRTENYYRAAFESAWMAHAITDGLTPAHHYPFEQKLEQLRGEGLETRNSTKEKLVLPGDTARMKIKNNWEFWGAKGVMTTHLAFELGVATTLSGASLDGIHRFDEADIAELSRDGFRTVFLHILHDVHAMGMYSEFEQKGWTRHLARETKHELVPLIVRAVCMGWYAAILQAQEA